MTININDIEKRFGTRFAAEIAKFNPYHDLVGRFTSVNDAASGSATLRGKPLMGADVGKLLDEAFGSRDAGKAANAIHIFIDRAKEDPGSMDHQLISVEGIPKSYGLESLKRLAAQTVSENRPKGEAEKRTKMIGELPMTVKDNITGATMTRPSANKPFFTVTSRNGNVLGTVKPHVWGPQPEDMTWIAYGPDGWESEKSSTPQLALWHLGVQGDHLKKSIFESLIAKFNQNHDVRGRFTSAADSVRNAIRAGKPVEKSRYALGKGASRPSVVTLDNGMKVVEKLITGTPIQVKTGQVGGTATSAIAYELSKRLGMTNFPVAALMENGALRSQFIEGRTLAGASARSIQKMYEMGAINQNDAQNIAVMAYLKHDEDMHGGNVLVDKNMRLWAIDMDSWNDNSKSDWETGRKQFSKAMSGVEVRPQLKAAMRDFVKNEDVIYNDPKYGFSNAVPEDQWQAIVRRAGKVAKDGVIP